MKNSKLQKKYLKIIKLSLTINNFCTKEPLSFTWIINNSFQTIFEGVTGKIDTPFILDDKYNALFNIFLINQFFTYF